MSGGLIWWLAVVALTAAGAVAGAGLIIASKPWLQRYALARPSARGLHTTPTPQGGGIAVLLASTLVAIAGAGVWEIGDDAALRLALVLAAAFGLAMVGFVDDVRPLPAAPRLILQLALMAVGVAMLPQEARVLPRLPFGMERALLVIGGAWFINLTNFMDGMDWMTVVNVTPVAAALVGFWGLGLLPVVPGLLALGLLAGLIGYAPFNRPVARLFLGDVGSLPIGFMIAFCLFSLAGQPGAAAGGPLIAAILLPLYPIADSGITLVWRLRRGEAVWQPHRSHFYQVAVLRGRAVPAVLRRIGAANAILAVLAWLSLRTGPATPVLALALGIILVLALLRWLGPESLKASA